MNTAHPLNKYDGHINTFSGKKVNLFDPQEVDINIRDISRGLAYNSHFGGQVPKFFSIAEHCLLVCDLMEREGVEDYNLLMAALLHDASEAYLGDMVKPLKVQMENFQVIENRMQTVIFKKFHLEYERNMKKIKPFDKVAQDFEYMAFYKGTDIELKFYGPEEALHEFRKRYFRYFSERIKLSDLAGENTRDNAGRAVSEGLAN